MVKGQVDQAKTVPMGTASKFRCLWPSSPMPVVIGLGRNLLAAATAIAWWGGASLMCTSVCKNLENRAPNMYFA